MNPLLLLLSLAAAQPDPALLAGLEYRQLPLTRGGRSTAVTGVAADPFTFYFGGIGGGVWKSTNAGTTWRNVSDRYFEAGSVGAIAVSDSNPRVVYAGTGTACPRVNVSPGDGVYRSDDGGETWVHAGLRDAGEIGRIWIHPRDPDLVYVAVLGHASARRGIGTRQRGLQQPSGLPSGGPPSRSAPEGQARPDTFGLDAPRLTASEGAAPQPRGRNRRSGLEL